MEYMNNVGFTWGCQGRGETGNGTVDNSIVILITSSKVPISALLCVQDDVGVTVSQPSFLPIP